MPGRLLESSFGGLRVVAMAVTETSVADRFATASTDSLSLASQVEDWQGQRPFTTLFVSPIPRDSLICGRGQLLSPLVVENAAQVGRGRLVGRLQLHQSSL